MTASAISDVFIAALAIGALGGCAFASGEAPAGTGYLARAQSGERGEVRVSAAALSADEAAAVYGVPLAEESIQPVWIEVENNEGVPYWLVFPGLDPNFFLPSEAAEAMALRDSDARLDELYRRFRELAFRNPVPPGGKVSGFVLTHLHEGVKLLQIDLFADRRSHSISFLAVVPGLRADYHESAVFRESVLAIDQGGVNYTDDEQFRAALEELPCCATNEAGTKNGDPLNLVIIGGLEDAFPALIRRGWTPTEVTWKGSVMRMMRSALSRDRYPYAPISDLYLFGRPQDVALQKARDNIHQRNHLRLWRSDMRYYGKPVWVGQISRDIGSRLTFHTPTFTTHKIDPDVDESAEALIEDLVYSQGLLAIGLVKGVGAVPKSDPRKNLTRDPYFTAGFRYVLLFDSAPSSLTDIRILPWESPGHGFVDQVVGGKRP